MNNSINVEITEYGKKKIEELSDNAWDWMSSENTFGDYLTVYIYDLVEEWLGEDILSMSIAKIEADKDTRLMILKRLCESPMMELFKKVENPEELL